MSLYGSVQRVFQRFGGGLVLDQDATEIGPDQASDAQNCDFSEQTLRKRLGRTPYNATAPVASQVRGLFRYYPKSGSPVLLMAAGTAVYADLNGNGSFADAGETLASGLTGGSPMDFLQYQDSVYFGNGVDAMRKWTGSGLASTLALLTAPAGAPTLAPVNSQLEAFNSGTWTATNAALLSAYVTDVTKDGTALKMTANAAGARGAFLYKAWSAGATVDLSSVSELSLWVYGANVGPTFQIGVYANGEALSGGPNWGLFPVLRVQQKKGWYQVRVPLAAIPPASRDASPGLAIKFIDDGDKRLPFSIWFDDLRPQGIFAADLYRYYYTYRNSTTGAESNPSPVAEIRLDSTVPLSGIQVTTLGTTQSGVDQIRVYRYRVNGPFRRARLVSTLTNPGTATSVVGTDYKSDGQLALEDADELVDAKTTPPLAYTYALVNHRMLAGAATASGTFYPWRIYLSRLGFPEDFGTVFQPDEFAVPGYLDLPEKDPIRRIIEFDGAALIFCARSIWTLEGSGWDDFIVRKRADIGLDAREAVLTWDRYIFFLAHDGLRVLAPNRSQDGLFETWLVSEPVASRIRAIPYAYRANCALGLDERQRVHLALIRSGQTVSDAALVFDPLAPGAMTPNPPDPRVRPGWTYYTSWGATCFLTLRKGGTDAGQLLAGDPATGKAHYCHRDGSDAAIETDGGSAVAWFWQSQAWDQGPGQRVEWVFVGSEHDVQSGLTLTAAPVLERAVSATTYALSLTAATSIKRTAPGIRARVNALKLSGSHSVAIQLHSATLGYWERGAGA
jgi:hypothetical protein